MFSNLTAFKFQMKMLSMTWHIHGKQFIVGGARNRVTFAAEKEHLIVIHPSVGEGDLVKLLGCIIDPKLTMQAAIDKLIAILKPKITALLKTRSTYNVQEMIRQFKTHIWGILEYHNGSIAHTSATSLARLDRLQRSFLEHLHMDERTAFLD